MRWTRLTLIPHVHYRRPMGSLQRGIALACAILIGQICQVAVARAEDLQKAQAAYKKGTNHYDLGEFREALESFKDAYRNREDPSFLFNLAQCYRQLGDKPSAIRSYRMYLLKVPSSPKAEQIREMIARLEAQVAEEANKPAAPTPTPAPAPTPSPAPAPSPTPAPVTAPTPSPGPAPTTDAAPSTAAASTSIAAPAPSTPVYKKWWLWTIVGVAVVGVGLGAGLGLGLSGSAKTPTATTDFGTFRF